MTTPELRPPHPVAPVRRSRPIDDALADGDITASVAALARATDAGDAPAEVLLGVLAPAMARVRERYALGRISTPRLQRATAAASAAASALAEEVPEPLSPKGKVLVACPEHDWYTVSASVLSVTLRATGWTALDLGAAVTCAQLADQLNDFGPDVVAVHCSVPAGLPSARWLTATAMEAGVPVLACGPVLGVDGRRAAALGATGWAAEPGVASAAIDALPVVATDASPCAPAVLAELADLELCHPDLVATVARHWAPLAEQVDAVGWGRFAELAEPTVANALHSVRGALVTGDPRLCTDTAEHQRRLLREHTVDTAVLPLLASAAREPLRDLPMGRALLDRHWTSPR